MMYGIGTSSEWWLMGMGLMAIFWIAAIALVIWGVSNFFPRRERARYENRSGAIEALQRRLGNGEIDYAEYERTRARLEGIPHA